MVAKEVMTRLGNPRHVRLLRAMMPSHVSQFFAPVSMAVDAIVRADKSL
jgi:hypothetical protein